MFVCPSLVRSTLYWCIDTFAIVYFSKPSVFSLALVWVGMLFAPTNCVHVGRNPYKIGLSTKNRKGYIMQKHALYDRVLYALLFVSFLIVWLTA